MLVQGGDKTLWVEGLRVVLSESYKQNLYLHTGVKVREPIRINTGLDNPNLPRLCGGYCASRGLSGPIASHISVQAVRACIEGTWIPKVDPNGQLHFKVVGGNYYTFVGRLIYAGPLGDIDKFMQQLASLGLNADDMIFWYENGEWQVFEPIPLDLWDNQWLQVLYRYHDPERGEEAARNRYRNKVEAVIEAFGFHEVKFVNKDFRTGLRDILRDYGDRVHRRGHTLKLGCTTVKVTPFPYWLGSYFKGYSYGLPCGSEKDFAWYIEAQFDKIATDRWENGDARLLGWRPEGSKIGVGIRAFWDDRLPQKLYIYEIVAQE